MPSFTQPCPVPLFAEGVRHELALVSMKTVVTKGALPWWLWPSFSLLFFFFICFMMPLLYQGSSSSTVLTAENFCIFLFHIRILGLVVTILYSLLLFFFHYSSIAGLHFSFISGFFISFLFILRQRIFSGPPLLRAAVTLGMTLLL